MTEVKRVTRGRFLIAVGAAVVVAVVIGLTYFAVTTSMRLGVVENYINGKAPQRNAAEQEAREMNQQQEQEIADLRAKLCAAVPSTCDMNP